MDTVASEDYGAISLIVRSCVSVLRRRLGRWPTPDEVVSNLCSGPFNATPDEARVWLGVAELNDDAEVYVSGIDGFVISVPMARDELLEILRS